MHPPKTTDLQAQLTFYHHHHHHHHLQGCFQSHKQASPQSKTLSLTNSSRFLKLASTASAASRECSHSPLLFSFEATTCTAPHIAKSAAKFAESLPECTGAATLQDQCPECTGAAAFAESLPECTGAATFAELLPRGHSRHGHNTCQHLLKSRTVPQQCCLRPPSGVGTRRGSERPRSLCIS